MTECTDSGRRPRQAEWRDVGEEELGFLRPETDVEGSEDD